MEVNVMHAAVLFCVWGLLHGCACGAQCPTESGAPVLCAVCSDSKVAVRWNASRNFDQKNVETIRIRYECHDSEGREVHVNDSCYGGNELGVYTDIGVLLHGTGHDSRIHVIDWTFPPGVECTFYGKYYTSQSVLPFRDMSFYFQNATCKIKEKVECEKNPGDCHMPASCAKDQNGDCYCRCSSDYEYEDETCTAVHHVGATVSKLCDGLKCIAITTQETASGNGSEAVLPELPSLVDNSLSVTKTADISPSLTGSENGLTTLVSQPSSSSSSPQTTQVSQPSSSSSSPQTTQVSQPSSSSSIPQTTQVSPSPSSIFSTPQATRAESGTSQLPAGVDAMVATVVIVPFILVLTCAVAVVIMYTIAIKRKQKRLKRIPSHLDFGFMTEKIDKNYDPVDSKVPLRHATSIYSILTSLEMMEKSQTQDDGTWSEASTQDLRESDGIKLETMSQFSVFETMNAYQSQLPPLTKDEALETSQSFIVSAKDFDRSQNCENEDEATRQAQPLVVGTEHTATMSKPCANGYTTEVQFSGQMSSKPTSETRHNSTGEKLPRQAPRVLLPPSAFSFALTTTDAASSMVMSNSSGYGESPQTEHFDGSCTYDSQITKLDNGYMSETGNMTPRNGTTVQLRSPSGSLEVVTSPLSVASVILPEEVSPLMSGFMPVSSSASSQPGQLDTFSKEASCIPLQSTSCKPHVQTDLATDATRLALCSKLQPSLDDAYSSGVNVPSMPGVERSNHQATANGYTSEEVYTAIPSLPSGSESMQGDIEDPPTDFQPWLSQGYCYSPEKRAVNTQAHGSTLPPYHVTPPPALSPSNAVEAYYLPPALRSGSTTKSQPDQLDSFSKQAAYVPEQSASSKPPAQIDPTTDAAHSNSHTKLQPGLGDAYSSGVSVPSMPGVERSNHLATANGYTSEEVYTAIPSLPSGSESMQGDIEDPPTDFQPWLAQESFYSSAKGSVNTQAHGSTLPPYHVTPPPAESPSIAVEAYYLPPAFHDGSTAKSQPDQLNAFSKQATNIPEKSTSSKLPALTTRLTPHPKLQPSLGDAYSSGISAPLVEMSNGLATASGYTSKEAITSSTCLPSGNEFVQEDCIDPPTNFQPWLAQESCYTPDNRSFNAQPHPPSHLVTSTSARGSINTVEPYYLPHQFNNGSTPVNTTGVEKVGSPKAPHLSFPANKATLVDIPESSQGDVQRALEPFQTQNTSAPFTIALLYSKPMQSSPRGCQGEKMAASENAPKPTTLPSTQYSSSPESYTSIDRHSPLTSRNSTITSEEEDNESSSMRKADMDPFSISPYHPQSCSTSGYASSSLNFSITDSEDSMFSIPAFSAEETEMLHHQSTTGYTTDSVFPPSPDSYRHQHTTLQLDRLTSSKTNVPHATNHVNHPMTIYFPAQPNPQLPQSQKGTPSPVCTPFSIVLAPAFSRDEGYSSDSPTPSLQHRTSPFRKLPEQNFKETSSRTSRLGSVDSSRSVESLPVAQKH